MDITAFIGIRNTMPLALVADTLSKALDVAFEKEESGRYEEYPAYIAYALGIEIVLMGPPAPEFDVRETPTDAYELQAIGEADRSAEVSVDLSSYLVALITEQTSLECWTKKSALTPPE